MSLTPSPSVSRGSVILQPSYFTSSLYVNPLREDICNLIQVYIEQYMQAPCTQPFALFKTIWTSQGWSWLHFKVFDARTREMFLRVTTRLFLEHLVETQPPLNRVVALFGLYTFFMTQPSTSTPSLYSITRVQIPLDVYSSLLNLPSTLTAPHVSPIQPHATYILSQLVTSNVFHILPQSSLNPQNPCILPREVFVHDNIQAASYEHVPRVNASARMGAQSSTPVTQFEPPSGVSGTGKKKGRPSKREKIKKAKEALVALDKWLEKTSFNPAPSPRRDHTCATTSEQQPRSSTITTLSPPQISISDRPAATMETYQNLKRQLIESLLSVSSEFPSTISIPAPLESTPGSQALHRANSSILNRLRKIDQMAAEKGLEVGGEEGGERTGLTRVEKASVELGVEGCIGRIGGILMLLEGAGLGEEEGRKGEADEEVEEGAVAER
ncbi:hypothetical protein JAAARDRAFT_65487 [Jaapia argillacea MUCL 33604]|uniref:Uncharacterized protein n=1 Tax=Jaapia argillacea MUCL 33604 TaxID=933084 RepID=A0A067Q929_9AGAM|nr:hypothetical protein JAAARDRAFT_65487 [Jaapia argillacea MUCL 33604]